MTPCDYTTTLLQYYIHLTAFFQDNPGKPAPEKQNHSGKTNLDLLEQEIVSGSGISWASGDMHICTSLQTDNHASTSPPYVIIMLNMGLHRLLSVVVYDPNSAYLLCYSVTYMQSESIDTLLCLVQQQLDIVRRDVRACWMA